MNYLETIKEEVRTAKTLCTHSNEAAGWFSRVEKNGSMVMYSYDENGELQTRYYKTIGTFARAIMNKTNGF